MDGSGGVAAGGRPVAAVSTLQRSMVALLGGLLLLAACAFHFARNVAPGQVAPSAMETIEVARNFATTRRLATGVIRPLVLQRLGRTYPDGRLPDTAHAPLYPVLAAVALRLTGQTAPTQGDQAAALLSLACFLASLGACYLLALRLFGASGALLACGLYALGAGVVTQAVTAHPALLAAGLFTLLLACLCPLDVKGTRRRAPLVWAAAAGALFGLLFLTIYSALLLFVPLAAYVWIVTKKDRRALAVFALVALLNPFTLGYAYRNVRVAGNPFFNAHLLELPMGTDTYPGTALYRSLGMTQSVPEFLASGGVMQVARKAVGNVVGYYENLPALLGVLVLPLFLVAAMTRFTNPVANRMRTLVYVLTGVHVLGLSLFVPYRDGLPLLLIYAPFVAIIATVFFLNFLRARNLPPFYARLALAAWVALACVPGLGRIFAPRGMAASAEATAPVYSVYDRLNNSGALLTQIRELRQFNNGVMVSDVPRELAFNVGVPTLWLPTDNGEVRAAADQIGKPVRGMVLTPTLATTALDDPAALPWRTTWNRVSSVAVTAGLLDPVSRDDLYKKVNRVGQFLPAEVRTFFQGYDLRDLAAEGNASQLSLVWWEKSPAPARPAADASDQGAAAKTKVTRKVASR